MRLVGVKKRLQMNRLWIKKEKMAAHPIAEASITLYLSLPLSLSDRGQSAGQSGGQSGERQRAKENEEGEVVPLLLLLPECFATAASRLTGLLRDSHTHLDFCPSEDPSCHSALCGHRPGPAASPTDTAGVIYTVLAPVPTVWAFLPAEHHLSSCTSQMCTFRCF